MPSEEARKGVLLRAVMKIRPSYGKEVRNAFIFNSELC
jgi:hypothetical protein